MDELLDWKHVAGPSPDLSTVVRHHVVTYLPTLELPRQIC